jgi:hypothetical protein
MPVYLPSFSNSIGGTAGDTATLIALDCPSFEQAPRTNRLVNNMAIERASLMAYSELIEINDLIKN